MARKKPNKRAHRSQITYEATGYICSDCEYKTPILYGVRNERGQLVAEVCEDCLKIREKRKSRS